MSPRIAYWTSAFDAPMEAIAGEVALLRRHFPRSVSWGLSRRHWAVLSPRKGYCLHPRLHLLFRAATRLLEPFFQVNHVVGSLGDWFYLHGPRRRPTVLTIAALAEPVDLPLLERVDRFIVEHPGGREELRRLGVGHERCRLVFPPVDLHRFRPSPPPEGPFTVLFASSPERADWLEARGVPLLLTAAALLPDVRFRLLWRPWGDALPDVQRQVSEKGLANVEVTVGRVRDMAAAYAAAHATVTPFTRPERCKPAPNSLVESLACGRPVVCTRQTGLAEVIEEARAGAVCAADGPELASALERVRREWADLSRRARALAERRFDERTYIEAHARLYRELLPSDACGATERRLCRTTANGTEGTTK